MLQYSEDEDQKSLLTIGNEIIFSCNLKSMGETGIEPVDLCEGRYEGLQGWLRTSHDSSILAQLKGYIHSVITRAQDSLNYLNQNLG